MLRGSSSNYFSKCTIKGLPLRTGKFFSWRPCCWGSICQIFCLFPQSLKKNRFGMLQRRATRANYFFIKKGVLLDPNSEKKSSSATRSTSEIAGFGTMPMHTRSTKCNAFAACHCFGMDCEQLFIPSFFSFVKYAAIALEERMNFHATYELSKKTGKIRLLSSRLGIA